MRFGFFIMPEPFPWSNWTLSYDLKLEEIVVGRALRLRRGVGRRAPHRRVREHPRPRHLHRQGVRR